MADSTQQEYDLSDIETVDEPAAPQIFADGYWGLAIADGVARINLYRLNYMAGEPKPQKVIVARLAIPEPSLWKIVDSLGQIRADIAKRASQQ
jgi:hypothetical protein